ncbi:indoleacetamide hydrolase [Arhodomonas sp. SL1]|uniref:indoleacetamide hydrolase n=1 Tax=Arhodomonas sp. SL1 TaxID=3425691 RepID=UPI003F8826B9
MSGTRFVSGIALLSVFLGGASAQALSDQELLRLGAGEAAEQIAQGELTSERLTGVLLERLEANRHLNAFITVNAEAALRQARRADEHRESGGDLPPLHGVPVVLKDNIDVAGLASTAGTPALAGHVPAESAPVAQALTDAGAIVLGKTNMHELAFGITSQNFEYGAVRNPYNALTFPGGSSGGTAVAVAALMAPAGLGTDTGGSVRIPSALTGLYGFRPSVGRYDQQGITPISHTRDTAGPIARNMADAVLLDGVLAGTSTGEDPVSLDDLRIGVPRGYFYENLDPDTRALTDAALKQLEEAGVTLVEADLEGIGELNRKVGFPLALYEVLRTLPEYLEGTSPAVTVLEVIENTASPDVAGALDSAIGEDREVGTEDDAISEAAYRQAMDEFRPQLQELYRDYFEQHDVEAVIFPATPLPARLIEGSVESVMLNGEAVSPFPTYIRNTDPGSNAGIPGLTVPVGVTPQGLPVAVELDGPAGSDRRLLAIGLALESVLGHPPRPVLDGGQRE